MQECAYHGDDLLLDGSRKGNQLEEQSKVELQARRVSHLIEFEVVEGGGSEQRTEETRRAREMVCWARVIVAAGWFETFAG